MDSMIAAQFHAERTKRVVNPEVPFAQGLSAALPSALRAVPGSYAGARVSRVHLLNFS